MGRVVLVVAEEHADLQRSRLERLGPDLLAALGGEDLDVAFLRSWTISLIEPAPPRRAVMDHGSTFIAPHEQHIALVRGVEPAAAIAAGLSPSAP
ncbi:hypothetical protein WME78_06245 [Sorangium sp. So ce1097]